MRRLSPRLFALAVLMPILGGGPAAAQATGPAADSSKRVSIRRLLAMQHTDSLMLAGIDEAFANETPSPDMPAGFLDSLHARVRRDIGQFTERLVPVYDSLFSATEIEDLLRFYQTPLGRRMLETQPRLSEATMDLARRWGIEVAAQVLLDLARHPVKRP